MTDQQFPAGSGQLSLRVAFAGGGSGGHVIAGTAIADELWRRDADCELAFLISSRKVDERILEAAGIPSSCPRVALPIESLAKGFRAGLRWSIRMARSLQLCRRTLRRFRPHVLIGLGGFASVPGVLAARSLGIPVVLIEQNCIPGRANRWLSRFAAVTCVGWPLTTKAGRRLRGRVVESGIPVRRGFREFVPAEQSIGDEAGWAANRRPRLLVLGGSQGAQGLNELIIKALGNVDVLPPSWEILHQTGSSAADAVADQWRAVGREVSVIPMIDATDRAMRRADVVISRAGAMTTAELCCLGKPSVLIALPTAADGHQAANAAFLNDCGAALMVDESADDAVSQLQDAIRQLVTDIPFRSRMAAATCAVARPAATITIVDTIRQVVRNSRSAEIDSCIETRNRTESVPGDGAAAPFSRQTARTPSGRRQTERRTNAGAGGRGGIAIEGSTDLRPG